MFLHSRGFSGYSKLCVKCVVGAASSLHPANLELCYCVGVNVQKTLSYVIFWSCCSLSYCVCVFLHACADVSAWKEEKETQLRFSSVEINYYCWAFPCKARKHADLHVPRNSLNIWSLADWAGMEYRCLLNFPLSICCSASSGSTLQPLPSGNRGAVIYWQL